MAKQKLNIEPKGFPTAMSEPYKSLKGVGSTFINIPLDLLDEIENQPFPINEEKVEQIARMFAGAVSFNQDLGHWHLDSLKKAKEMEQFLSGEDSFDCAVNRIPVLKCRKASKS